MKNFGLKRPFGLKKFMKCLLAFAGYTLLTFADGRFAPFSVALLSANLYVGLPAAAMFTLYLLPFAASFSPMIILYGFSGGAVILVFYLVAGKLGKKPSFSLAFAITAAVVPYVFLSDAYNITVRAIVAGVTVPLGFVFVPAAKVFIIKGLKYRLSTDELVSAAILYILAAYGGIRIFSLPVYEAFSVLFILLSASVLKRSHAPTVAIIAALPAFVFTENAAMLAPPALYGLVAVCLCPHSKLATGIGILVVKLLLWNFTDIYSDWLTWMQCAIIAPVCLYLFIPSKVFANIRDKLTVYKDNNLGKYALNRSRLSISGKLFEISSVFDEMSASIKKLSENADEEKQATADMGDELFVKCCSGCKKLSECRSRLFPSDDDLGKIVSLATAKGRLNLADLPSAFSSKCSHQEKIVEAANDLVALSERELLKAESMKHGRELILAQTDGLSEVLKNIACKTSMRLETKGELAGAISKNLLSAGIYAYETQVFGEGNDTEINVLLPKKQATSKLLLKAVKEIIGFSVTMTDVFNVSEELTAITLKRTPVFDAAFSVAQKTKSDKEKSGDTHSVTKISEGKFLIALNDGMGSGKKASETSATTISLIETFYKAELSSETVLSTVNKILSFNGEDNFTALDIGVIDLFSGSADFIKIGSPYSFVITKDAVKIVEGSSLPLGILDELHPTVCKTELHSGDVVVFVSDGISDAFGSSSDFIDFLSAQRALNPKSLADNILEKALLLDGQVAKDDMTAFCVRIFKKAS